MLPAELQIHQLKVVTEKEQAHRYEKPAIDRDTTTARHGPCMETPLGGSIDKKPPAVRDTDERSGAHEATEQRNDKPTDIEPNTHARSPSDEFRFGATLARGYQRSTHLVQRALLRHPTNQRDSKGAEHVGPGLTPDATQRSVHSSDNFG